MTVMVIITGQLLARVLTGQTLESENITVMVVLIGH